MSEDNFPLLVDLLLGDRMNATDAGDLVNRLRQIAAEVGYEAAADELHRIVRAFVKHAES